MSAGFKYLCLIAVSWQNNYYWLDNHRGKAAGVQHFFVCSVDLQGLVVTGWQEEDGKIKWL